MTVTVTERKQKLDVRQKQEKGTDKVFLQLMLTSNMVTLPLPEGWWCLVVFFFYTQHIRSEGMRSSAQ